MKFQETNLSGLYVVGLERHMDGRGLFQKPFNQKDFQAHGLETNLCECYYSVSTKDVLRGMHFQAPPADHAKLVYVSHGRILDVALDIRRESPTYGKYFSCELSPRACEAIYIPRGFAHGFRALEDNSIVNYVQTSCYDSAKDCGIRLDSFGFDWGVRTPILSERDQSFPLFKKFESPFLV